MEIDVLMNEKQRIKNCIHFKELDKVPWQIDYTSEIASRIIAELGLRETYLNVLGKNIFRYNVLDDYFGNHICYLRSTAANSFEEVDLNIWKDEWGVIWDRHVDRDIGTQKNIVLENLDVDALHIPDPSDPERFMHFKPMIEAQSNRYILVKISRCLFER